MIEQSKRPYGIVPEKRRAIAENMAQCIVVFFCVEQNDTEKQMDELCREVIKTSDEFGNKNLMISPFVHLSKNIAKPEVAKKFYEDVLKRFEKSDFNVQSSHFGYHKSLLLDIKGHPGSFRFREF